MFESDSTTSQLDTREFLYYEELKHIVNDDLKDITFIEACKLYVHASITGDTCDCKGKCITKQCPCKRMGVYCSTKCHSKRGGCKNMGE
ncbi:unnamed protein product [Rotaria sp. Silwood2]|nr:unnamed protein product [Rotaria sp. Silwood2]